MINEEVYKTIRDCGFLDYSAREMYEYIQEYDESSFQKLNMSIEEFEEAFNTQNSNIFLTYQYFPTIKKCGALEYDAETIAAILMTDAEEFAQLLADPKSREARKYKQGLLESKFRIESALVADAESGNKDAIRLLMRSRKEAEIAELKNILFGDAKTIRELKP